MVRKKTFHVGTKEDITLGFLSKNGKTKKKIHYWSSFVESGTGIKREVSKEAEINGVRARYASRALMENNAMRGRMYTLNAHIMYIAFISVRKRNA